MASKTETKGRKFRLRPGHLIIFIVFIIIRKGLADEHHDQPSHGGSSDHSNFDDRHSASGKNGGHEGGHHHKEAHFSVFHVNFEHVEVPFIIALWIFVSSLAKVGM